MTTPGTIGGGRYICITPLGGGYFGEVWLAHDDCLDAEVAVKLLEPNVNLDDVLLESQLLERLRRHDRVANVRDVHLGPPAPFIVMDYLPGGSVGARLAAGYVSLSEAVRWVREALGGLAHAHSLGVIHRDIKPDNLLLDDQDRALISDFGIAEDTARGRLATNASYQLHTAPEMARLGSSPQTDIWAMGCTLYRLVTGEYPYPDPAQIGISPLVDPHTVNPQIPLSLTRVIRKALAVEPSKRYQSATEMMSALAECSPRCSWRQVAASDGDLEVWETDMDNHGYELIVSKERTAYRVRLRRDRGKGLRLVHSENAATLSRARQIRTRVLRALVEGRSIG